MQTKIYHHHMTMQPKTFYCYNHQEKGTKYIQALQDAGFRYSSPNSASVLLMDYDVGGRIITVRSRLTSGQLKLFIYPHSAAPNVGWDGLIPKSAHITGIFVSAKGHADILRRIGVKEEIFMAGWAYCEQKDFQPVENPRQILFAPLHPTKRGYLSRVNADLNLRAFKRLLPLRDRYEITVRHIRSLEANGIPRVDGITYVDANTCLKTSTAQVDEMDVIIGSQTIAYIAVARGKPTLMIGEDIPPRNGTNEGNFKYTEHFEDYRDLLMYPLDILGGGDTMELIEKAARSDDEIRDWRERMIGEPFNPQTVTDAVNSFL